MKLNIEHMEIKNFKGVAGFKKSFSERTAILSPNKGGKTTLFDAFLWCMFGIISDGSAQFNIKTLNKDNEPIHHLNHEVTVVLSSDEDGNKKKYSFKKGWYENWQTRRGDKDPHLKGHVGKYWLDSFEKTKAEYEKAVAALFPEDVSKIMTNPKYFNQLPKDQKRKIVFEVAGEISTIEIASRDKKFRVIHELLDRDHELEAIKQRIREDINREKASMKLIPPRIDEVKQRMDSIKVDKSLTEIRERQSAISKEVDKLDRQIADKFHAKTIHNDEGSKLREKIIDLEAEYSKAGGEERKKAMVAYEEALEAIHPMKMEVRELEDSVKSKKREVENLKEDEARLKREIENLRGKYKDHKMKEPVVSEDNLVCPTCERPFENAKEKEEEIKQRFNEEKASKLKRISDEGHERANECNKVIMKINELEEELEADEMKLDGKKSKLSLAEQKAEKLKANADKVEENDKQKTIKEKIQMLDAEYKEKYAKDFEVDTSKLEEKKEAFRQEMAEITSIASQIEDKDKSEARIGELEQEHKEYAERIAELHHEESLVMEIEKIKAEEMVERVKKVFPDVDFKLYNKLVNGGEEPTFETLVDGVPWHEANNADKINVGIRIINHLGRHFDFYGPIWIDNAESINEIEESDSQIVALYVDKFSLDKYNEVYNLK